MTAINASKQATLAAARGLRVAIECPKSSEIERRWK
jgi:hypothetical protein